VLTGCLLGLGCWLFPTAGAAAPSHVVEDLRYRSTAQETRVTIEVNSSVPYEIGRFSHSNRLYIDLPKTRLAPDWERRHLTVNDGRLSAIRITQPATDQIRITLDLQQGDFHVFTLPHPYRIIVDLLGSRDGLAQPAPEQRPPGPAAAERAALSERPAPGRKSAPPPATPATRAPARQPPPKAPTPVASARARPFTVVIDPGHGGHDPGAIGPRGVAEKTVVLRIAKELRLLLRQALPQARVLLTREQDVFIPLRKRAAMANTAKADLFLSIHANSSPQPQASGIETWYLSFAANERAQQLAARENQTAAVKLSEIDRILRDLRETDRINESAAFAGVMQAALVKHLGARYSGVLDRGIDGAPFVVLLHTAMPSILVEVAFISNPRDAGRLQSPPYQEALAQGIFRGVRQYLNATALAAQ
jgi:N-acetylmuramoyl-L-alanine amidase